MFWFSSGRRNGPSSGAASFLRAWICDWKRRHDSGWSRFRSLKNAGETFERLAVNASAQASSRSSAVSESAM